MENEPISITLTIGQWNTLLLALGNAPFTQVVESIRLLQEQAAPQVKELQAKYPPQEEAVAAE